LLLAVVDTERGIDVLIVVTGWDTIELNSVDVVCKSFKILSINHAIEPIFDLHARSCCLAVAAAEYLHQV
jgi:hypothetical protein